jgi:hypothetical protein
MRIVSNRATALYNLGQANLNPATLWRASVHLSSIYETAADMSSSES